MDDPNIEALPATPPEPAPDSDTSEQASDSDTVRELESAADDSPAWNLPGPKIAENAGVVRAGRFQLRRGRDDHDLGVRAARKLHELAVNELFLDAVFATADRDQEAPVFQG